MVYILQNSCNTQHTQDDIVIHQSFHVHQAWWWVPKTCNILASYWIRHLMICRLLVLTERRDFHSLMSYDISHITLFFCVCVWVGVYIFVVVVLITYFHLLYFELLICIYIIGYYEPQNHHTLHFYFIYIKFAYKIERLKGDTKYRLYSINWPYSRPWMSEPLHPHGNFVLANYLLLDNQITIVVVEG